MPVSLPAGFLDTGITFTVTISVTMRLRWSAGLVVWLPHNSEYRLSVVQESVTNKLNFFLDLLVSPFTSTLIDQLPAPGIGESNSDRGMMATSYDFSTVRGPFRLAASYGTASGVRTESFTWWADADSELVEDFDGHARTRGYGASPFVFDTGITDWRFPSQDTFPFWNIGFALNFTNNLVMVEFTNIAVNGYAPDLSGIATTWFDGVGTDAVNALGVHTGSGIPPGQFFGFAVPVGLHLDADVIDSAGNAIAGALLTPSQTAGGATFPAGPITCPHAADHLWQPVSWASYDPLMDRLALQTAWADAYDPPVAASDRAVPFLQPGPLQDPTVRGTFAPATITLDDAVPILRSSNLWVGSGPVSVAGSAFTVSGAGASVTRTLQESWRDWTGFGVGGKDHAEWGADRYTITKADYLEDTTDDVWGWATYSYLRLGITVPAGGTLTLTVSGQFLSVTDNHSTVAATRKAGFASGLTAFTKTYSVPVNSGANSVLIDLLFPNEGGPFYYGRVDSVKLEGFAVGVSTLTALQLEAVEDGYLKVDYSTDGRIVGLHTANDGAWPFANLPDLPWKEDEIGTFGGSLPWLVLQNVTTGATAARTVPDFLEDLNRIEGYTVTWTQATFDAACQDAYGQSFISQGDWVEPLMPHARLQPAVAYAPALSVRADRVDLSLANGVGTLATDPFLLYARKRLGAVLEAQVVTAAGARSGASVQVDAIRTDTGVQVTSGFTDVSGFVTVPVPSNGSRAYRLEAVG